MIVHKNPNPLLRLWGNTCDKVAGFFYKQAVRYAVDYDWDDWCDCD